MSPKINLGKLKQDVDKLGSGNEHEIAPAVLYIAIEVGVAIYLITS